MSKIIKQDTQGTRPLLQTGELGYDNYVAGGDTGRVYVGTGSANVALAKKAEVTTVDGKIDTHVARFDNPHGVTKIQVGLGNVDNTSDANKPISTAAQAALNLKANLASPALTGMPTAPTAVVGTNSTVLATTAFVNAEITNDTYSKAQLDAGQLDNRYYTEAEVDSKLAAQNGANDISVTPTGNLTSSNVQSALVELQGDIDNRYTKTETNTLLSNKVDDTEKGSANGVATLDANGKVTLTQIPDSVLGQLEYQGVWDFTTLPTATQKGQYWVASVSGNGYIVGDWAVWNGSAFDKIDNTDAVATVAGRTGNVVLTKSDVGLSNVDNTADANKTVLSATKLTTPRNINGVSFDGTSDITVSDNTKLPIGGKAADSDLLDGMQPTTSSAANSIGQRGWDAGFAASYFYANGANARFEAASPVNDWKFFRLASGGTPKWDIGTNETNENGALAFRTGDGVNKFLMYHTGELATTNTMYLQQGLSLRERGTLKEILYHSGEVLNLGHGFSDVRINNQKAWHAGNDGSGSGMDADLLDGLHSTSFLRNDSNNNGGLHLGSAATRAGVARTIELSTNTAFGGVHDNHTGIRLFAYGMNGWGTAKLGLQIGSNFGVYGSTYDVWHSGNVSFDSGATPYTAVYRNASGNFDANTIKIWSALRLDNATGDTPAVIMTSYGYASWEMDVSNGIFRLRTTDSGDNREIIKITPSTPTPNESYKLVVPSVYNNLASGGAIAVMVDGDGGIRRASSSIKYKTNVEDIYKEAVDTFFANARPIYYKDKHPQEGKDWGYWGFIAEEVDKFDKRLVHYGYSGTKEEVVKKATYYTEDDELPEGKEIGDEKTPDIISEVIDTSSPLTPEGIMYDRITVLLTAKVQEQDKEIKSLREELDELKLIVKGLIG